MTKTLGIIDMDLAETSTVVPLRGLGCKIETAQRSIIAPSHGEGRMQTLAGDALPESRRNEAAAETVARIQVQPQHEC